MVADLHAASYGISVLEMDIVEILQQYVGIFSGIAQIAIVFLLWRTVKDFEETGKVSKIQVEHRFRPWVGPSSGVEYVGTVNGQHQYAITIKNYGEVPASQVTASFTMKHDVIPTRQILFSDPAIHQFNLGPLLPGMEKRYWIFIDSDLIDKSKNGKLKIYIALYFSYEFSKEKSGYGMISTFDSKTNLFIHQDMWIN
jgi:hypothetical protein